MASRTVIKVTKLKPTQITVGMLQVKHKARRLKQLEKRPAELVEFILEHPIRVVLGPKDRAYVIDHHHLALALLKGGFETAPMDVEEDFSQFSMTSFWKKMQTLHFVHPYDAHGELKSLAHIPEKLESLKDDVYRSLAGFVREAGGFAKVKTPYAEFLWADFFRNHIKHKFLKKHFDKVVKHAVLLARTKDAEELPGFISAPMLVKSDFKKV